MEFADSWLWLVFVAVGLVLAALELIAGVETGFDLVVIGSVFIIGGLVTLPFHSWVPTVIVTSVISVAYVGVGRRYIHRWTATREEKTNIDAIVGRKGIVHRDIAKYVVGRVKIDNQSWRARAEENIKEGDEVVVTGVSGATLIVNKTEGGN